MTQLPRDSMAADLLKAIQALPASVDPYDFLLDQFGTQVFPAMTDAFWLQAHIATGLLGASIVVTLTALTIKARKGRLHWFIEDGAATRPSPRVFTPVLFSVVAVCKFTQAKGACKRRGLTRSMCTTGSPHHLLHPVRERR